MTADTPIRRATADDAPACAAILNDWIDATDWMPRIHPSEDVVRHYRQTVLPTRRVWVAGDPVHGFLALEPAAGAVAALYLAPGARGCGIGRALLMRAREGRAALHLWTFEANEDARRFYEANGFRRTARTDGDNEEGLPDLRYDWAAA
ncbi:MAG: GNAT family N-acetyltransferase [Jannaschia sp.]